jgi:hypothetical protein
MKKIIKFLQNWFEQWGFFKMIIAFGLMCLFIWLNSLYSNIILLWASYIFGGYIALSALLLIGSGIVNWIKDIRDDRTLKFKHKS